MVPISAPMGNGQAQVANPPLEHTPDVRRPAAQRLRSTIASSEQEAASTPVSIPETVSRCLLSLTQALGKMKEPLRKAVSPDGKLTLAVFEQDDYYIGFEGQAWHTHGDLLVSQYGTDARAAALAFFEAVLRDREVICVAKRVGRDEEIWVTDDAQKEGRYLEPGEVLELRLWSGQRIARHENTA